MVRFPISMICQCMYQLVKFCTSRTIDVRQITLLSEYLRHLCTMSEFSRKVCSWCCRATKSHSLGVSLTHFNEISLSLPAHAISLPAHTISLPAHGISLPAHTISLPAHAIYLTLALNISILCQFISCYPVSTA